MTPADAAYNKLKTMLDSPIFDTGQVLVTITQSDLYDLVQGYGKLNEAITGALIVSNHASQIIRECQDKLAQAGVVL